MAKKASREKFETKHQASRRERESRQLLYLYAGLGVVAILIALILVYFGVVAPIQLGNESIATVNDKPIYVRDFQPRVRYQSALLQLQLQQIEQTIQQLQDPSLASFRDQYISQYNSMAGKLQTIGQDTLATMIDDELVRQETERRGITVTNEAIDREMELDLKEGLGYPRPTATLTPGPSPTSTNTPTQTPIPTATSTPTLLPSPTATLSATATATPTELPTLTPQPTQTPLSAEAYQTKLNEYKDNLSKLNVPFETYRQIVTMRLLRARLSDALGTTIATSGEQVHARHILVNTYTEAISITNQLKAGKDFADLARTLSRDTGSGARGGDLGWSVRGNYVKEFDDTAFTAPISQTQLVTTTFGVHILQVLERDANRPLAPDQLITKRATALEDWLATVRNSSGVKRSYKPDYLPSDVRKLLGLK